MTAHQPSAKRRDIHAEITAKLIASIERELLADSLTSKVKRNG